MCGLSTDLTARAFCLAGGKLRLAQIEKAHNFGDKKTSYRCLMEKVGGNQVRVLSFMSNVWIKNDEKKKKWIEQKHIEIRRSR